MCGWRKDGREEEEIDLVAEAHQVKEGGDEELRRNNVSPRGSIAAPPKDSQVAESMFSVMKWLSIVAGHTGEICVVG